MSVPTAFASFEPPTGEPSASSRWVARVMGVVMRPSTAIIPTNALGAAWARAFVRLATGVLAAPDRGTQIAAVHTEHDGRPVTGEWVRAARVESAAGAHGAGVVLYLHGSGYFICSPRTHRGLVSRLSAASGLPAFVPAYRKGPEHCYPAAADDIRAAYDWLLAQGFAPDRIVVAGDSAGGHLAITLAADLCREGLPVPAGLVLLSPLVDPTWALAAARDRECRDPFATARGARRLVGLYMRTADLTDPRVAVLRGEPAGLPPMLVQAGGREMLAADAEALAVFVASGGGTCRLQVWPGQVHVFQIFFHLLPEAVAALADAGRFIRDALGAGELAQDAPGAVTRAA